MDDELSPHSNCPLEDTSMKYKLRGQMEIIAYADDIEALRLAIEDLLVLLQTEGVALLPEMLVATDLRVTAAFDERGVPVNVVQKALPHEARRAAGPAGLPPTSKLSHRI